MTTLGLLLGMVGTDFSTGAQQFTFGFIQLSDGVEIVALALGLFGIAESIKSVNRVAPIDAIYAKVRLRDMRPGARS